MNNPIDFSTTMRIDIPPGLVRKAETAAKLGAKLPKKRPTPFIRLNPRASQNETHSTTGSFPSALKRIYDAVVIINGDGAIVDCNERASDLLLYPAQELRGLQLRDLISGADDNLASTIRDTVIADRHIVIQACCTRKDGELITVEITASVLDIDKLRFCLFVRDISARRQSEEMLRTCYNAITNARSGIAVCDVQGNVVYANPAAVRMWGGDSDADVVGRPLSEFFEPRSVMTTLMSSLSAGLDHWEVEVMMRRADNGENTFQHVTGSCNRNEDQVVTGMVLSFIDTTDQHRAEKAKREAEAQRAMVASLATTCHHIGQPATVLVSCMSILQRHLKDSDVLTKEMLDECTRAVDRIGDLLRQFNSATQLKFKDYLTSSAVEGRDNEQILDLPIEG